METVGVQAHRGGFLVDEPEVTVGVVRAVSRLEGLEVELISRVPGDRVGPPGDRWPPVYDEGVDLRLGWLDDGRVRWAYPALRSSTSHYQFPSAHFRATFALPSLFGDVSLVLAWPEVGFPETVVGVALPDRATVERDDSPLWTAGVGLPVTGDLVRYPTSPERAEFDVESGTVVAAPVVLHGSTEAVVALTRATVVGSRLSLEVLSTARGDKGETVRAAFGPAPFDRWGRPPYGVAIAVVDGAVAHELRSSGGGASTDARGYTAETEFVVPRPETDFLDLVVSWPLAGLDEVRVRVGLSHG